MSKLKQKAKSFCIKSLAYFAAIEIVGETLESLSSFPSIITSFLDNINLLIFILTNICTENPAFAYSCKLR